MAMPTLVNSAITDSVTQGNLAVLANAPAVAMGSLYQSSAHSTGIMYQNSVQAQQQAAIAGQAAMNMGVMQIYSLNTMAAASATAKVAGSDEIMKLLTMLVALKVLDQM